MLPEMCFSSAVEQQLKFPRPVSSAYFDCNSNIVNLFFPILSFHCLEPLGYRNRSSSSSDLHQGPRPIYSALTRLIAHRSAESLGLSEAGARPVCGGALHSPAEPIHLLQIDKP
ncbi:hypothetical protein NQZ68_033576 [Dissostichus eleginoides]|nr:hypothetical protein NQZ68_026390 [Dissostichus eleginoides]KAI9541117.1 hypothetical protein NQZ68_033576 [Dissostichus eleginoides]